MGPSPRVQTPGQPSLGKGFKIELGGVHTSKYLVCRALGQTGNHHASEARPRAHCSKRVLAQGLGACQNILQSGLARKVFRVFANALGFLAGVC